MQPGPPSPDTGDELRAAQSPPSDEVPRGETASSGSPHVGRGQGDLFDVVSGAAHRTPEMPDTTSHEIQDKIPTEFALAAHANTNGQLTETIAAPSPSPAEEAAPPLMRRIAQALLSLALAATAFIATTSLVFVLVGGASYLILKAYVGGKETEVPPVVGLTLDQALEKLTPRQLYLELFRREYSETVERNSVVAQSPAPGTKVKARTPVRVVLSDGAARKRAPKLIGMTEINAGVALRSVEQADLDVSQTAYAYSSSVGKGTVISQDPPPGTPILRGSRINLLVSLGPRPVYFEMPNLIGKTIQEGRIALGAMQLAITDVRKTDFPGQRQDVVVKQEPASGQRVKRGDPIVLTTPLGLGQATP